MYFSFEDHIDLAEKIIIWRDDFQIQNIWGRGSVSENSLRVLKAHRFCSPCYRTFESGRRGKAESRLWPLWTRMCPFWRQQ
jgi:hypothetical protein